MAVIEVRGYVNKPASKESSAGKKFCTWTLAERQKGRGGATHKVYYSVVDFERPAPPESSFVTLKGYLNVEKVEKDGKTFTNLNITCTSLDIAPPRGDDAGNKENGPPTEADDNWAF